MDTKQIEKGHSLTLDKNIEEINSIFRMRNFTANQIKTLGVSNAIFSFNNFDEHYLCLPEKGFDVYYCYSMYHRRFPKNEKDIKRYCSIDNLYRSIHSNDCDLQISLVAATASACKKILKKLKN